MSGSRRSLGVEAEVQADDQNMGCRGWRNMEGRHSRIEAEVGFAVKKNLGLLVVDGGSAEQGSELGRRLNKMGRGMDNWRWW